MQANKKAARIAISVSEDTVVIAPSPELAHDVPTDIPELLASVRLDNLGRIHITHPDFADRVRHALSPGHVGRAEMANGLCGGGGPGSSNSYCTNSLGTNTHCSDSPAGTNTHCDG